MGDGRARRPPGRRAAHRADAHARVDRPGTASGVARRRACSRATRSACASTSAPGARLDVALDERRGWPRRAFGGLGPAQVVPGLAPVLASAPARRAGRGHGDAGGATVDLDGADRLRGEELGRGVRRALVVGPGPGLRRPRAVRRLRRRARAAGAASRRAPTAVVVAAGDEAAPPRAAVRAHGRRRGGRGGWRVRARSARHRVELEGDAGRRRARSPLPVPVPGRRAVEPRSRQAPGRPAGASRCAAAAARSTATSRRSPGWSTAGGLAGLSPLGAARRRERLGSRPAARTGRPPPTARAGASRRRRRPAPRAPR